jgi:uncharacterized protein YjbJ (UPF0337 family)
MGITDKVTGRAKQAVGDLTGKKSTAREGQQEEKKGETKEEAARAQEAADEKSREASRLEGQT